MASSSRTPEIKSERQWTKHGDLSVSSGTNGLISSVEYHCLNPQTILFIGIYSGSPNKIKVILKNYYAGICIDNEKLKEWNIPFNPTDLSEIPWDEMEEVDERVYVFTSDIASVIRFIHLVDKYFYLSASIKKEILDYFKLDKEVESKKPDPLVSLNGTQKSIIDAYLQYPLDSINDELKEDTLKKISAYQAIIDDSKKFEEQNISESIEEIRKILSHPCPQNRRVGDPSAASGAEDGIISGEVHYWIDHFGGRRGREPQGLLGLTAKNDITAPAITKDAVVSYIKQVINIRIAQLKFQDIAKDFSLKILNEISIEVSTYLSESLSLIINVLVELDVNLLTSKMKDHLIKNMEHIPTLAQEILFLQKNGMHSMEAVLPLIQYPEFCHGLAIGFVRLQKIKLLSESNRNKLIDKKEDAVKIAEAIHIIDNKITSSILKDFFRKSENASTLAAAIWVLDKNNLLTEGNYNHLLFCANYSYDLAIAFCNLAKLTDIESDEYFFASVNLVNRSQYLMMFNQLVQALIEKGCLTKRNYTSLIQFIKNSQLIWEAFVNNKAYQKNFTLILHILKRFKEASLPPSAKDSILELLSNHPTEAFTCISLLCKLDKHSLLNVKIQEWVTQNINYSIYFNPLVNRLKKGGILTKENINSLIQYAQFSRLMAIDCINETTLSQVRFDQIIEQARSKMKMAFLHGTHQRLGSISSILPFFTKMHESPVVKDSLSDKQIFSEIFKLI